MMFSHSVWVNNGYLTLCESIIENGYMQNRIVITNTSGVSYLNISEFRSNIIKSVIVIVNAGFSVVHIDAYFRSLMKEMYINYLTKGV